MNPLDSHLRSLELDRVLEIIALEARTTPGRNAVRRRRPSSDPSECDHRQALLAEMVRFHLAEGNLPLAGLVAVDETLASEMFELADAWGVIRAAKATQTLRQTLRSSRDLFPLLHSVSEGIADLDTLLRDLGRYFTNEGKLREDATPELRRIRSKIHGRRSAIQKTLVDIMTRHGDAVQDALVTMRGDRYCIPLRSEKRGEVPSILHERSGSGATVFAEPLAIVEANNELSELLIEEREEIARITRYIAGRLREASEPIARSVMVAGELDAIQACAIVHQQAGCSRPKFSRGSMTIVEGRHPLLDERLADLRSRAFGESDSERVIPVSFELGEGGEALVVSGPNAGGKTVSLKTAGLLTAMAASGLPVPAAEGTVLPVVDAIHVLIGDEQDVLEHLSTFSAYLVRLRRILETATEKSLVLLDELGSGTDPEEGAALAASVIEHILEKGSLLVATTHLSALKSFAIGDDRIVNASMEFDAATGSPTFRMIRGVPGRSRAIETARRMGLPAAVIERANERLGDMHGDVDQMLAELQRLTTAAEKLRDDLRSREAELHRAEERSRREREAVEEERKKLAKNYRAEFDQLRRDVRARLQSELGRMKADSEHRAKTSAGSLAESILQPLEKHEEDVLPPRVPPAVGDEAEHRTLRFRGRVVSIDGNRVTMDVRGKTMQTTLDDLSRVGEDVTAEPPSLKRSRESAASASDADESAVSAELNLIGERVDDALAALDRFLDQSLLDGRKAVRIIHGFGTGALRNAVREELRRHRGVRSHRAGGETEGGDGATVAVLDV